MRTLDQISETLLQGEDPAYEELYWACLAYMNLFLLDHQKLMDNLRVHANHLSGPPLNAAQTALQHHVLKRQREDAFERVKVAMSKDPQSWVGPNHDPKQPAFQHRRKQELKMVNHFLKQAENKEEQNDKDLL